MSNDSPNRRLQDSANNRKASSTSDTNESEAQPTIPEFDLSKPKNGQPIRFGRYELLRRLGKGAMGYVYLAMDPLLNRYVALKIPKVVQGDAKALLVARFMREVRAVARLKHPSICPVYDVGEADGRHYVAMQFIDGLSLDKYIGNGKSLEPRQSEILLCRIAMAMHHADEQGVVHRDLWKRWRLLSGNVSPLDRKILESIKVRRRTTKRILRESGIGLQKPAEPSILEM